MEDFVVLCALALFSPILSAIILYFIIKDAVLTSMNESNLDRTCSDLLVKVGELEKKLSSIEKGLGCAEGAVEETPVCMEHRLSLVAPSNYYALKRPMVRIGFSVDGEFEDYGLAEKKTVVLGSGVHTVVFMQINESNYNNFEVPVSVDLDRDMVLRISKGDAGYRYELLPDVA